MITKEQFYHIETLLKDDFLRDKVISQNGPLYRGYLEILEYAKEHKIKL
jgi:hypothetical protein